MLGPYTEVVDSEVQEALDGELERQRTTIELIASENFASPAVLGAGLGSDQQVRRGLSW